MKNRFSDIFLSKGVNYYSGDVPFQVILEYFGFKGDRDLRELGIFVSEELIEALDYIDHHGKPVLQNWGVMGDRIDYVRLAPEHYRILEKLQKFGIIRKMVNGEESIFYHFLSGYIISDSGIFCTLTLTAQTAYALEKYADRKTRSDFLRKFGDHEDPWYGATYYSEIQGGSDLGANTTRAVKADNSYRISGTDKYFASNAGIADGAIVTARLDGSVQGAKGISAFFVPARRSDGTANYTIRRLKDKMGTIAVPTGEVEFSDSEAYILGNGKNGIQIAMEILTISRIDDAIAAAGIARKAFWEANIYARKRTAFGKKLIDHVLMQKDLIERESELEASVVVSMLAAKLFEEASGSMPPYNDGYTLARIMSSISKYMAAETSAEITRYSMEIMGGIGFFEEFPVAKFHRDSIVTSIWEGTSNIQALEMLESVVKKNAGSILHSHLKDAIGKIRDRNISKMLSEDLNSVFEKMKGRIEKGEGEFYSKETLAELGNITASIYMFLIGQENLSGCAMVTRAGAIFHSRHFHPGQVDREFLADSVSVIEWMNRNREITSD